MTYRRLALKAALLGSCLFMPLVAHAQGDQPEGDQTSTDRIVISGEIEYRDRTDTTAPELVYDQEFFAAFEPVSVGDQLRRVPGVAFTSDVGEADAPQLRGLGQGFTQILVNGRPIPGAGNDRSVFVDRIPAEIIDRIEIVRSPSADIDSQGVGGTINIILKNGESLPPGLIARAGATFDVDREETRPNASLSWSGRNEDRTVLYSLTLDAQQRYNNKEVVEEVFEADSVGFADEVAAGGDGRRLARFDNIAQSVAIERVEEEDTRDSTDLSLNGDLTWKLSDKTSLRFDTFILSTDREESQNTVIYEGDGSVGGLDLLAPAFEFQAQDFKQNNVGAAILLKHEMDASTDFEAQVRFNNFKDETSAEDFEDTPDNLVGRETIDADDTEWTADASLTHDLPGFATALGIQEVELKYGVAAKTKDRTYGLLIEEDLADPDFTANDGQFSYEEKRLDAFARVEWSFNDSVRLQTGVRAESTDTSISFQNDFYEADVLQDSISGSADTDEFMVNPSAHLVWEVSDEDQIRVSVARTVRRPSIDQMIPAYALESPGDEDVTIGNPNLQFETSTGFDIGYEHRLEGRGIIGINAFQRDISDLIGLVNTGEGVDTIGLDPADFPGGLYSYLNIGDAKVWGIELDVSTPLSFIGLPDTGFFANYTRLWSERADPAGGGDIMLDFQPEYVYNVGISHNIEDWDASFGASYQKQGESRFVTFGEIESQLYDGNLEVFLEKRFGDNYVLRLTGTNLLDADSQQAEAGFDGDNGADILANQAAFAVDAYEVERESSSPKVTLTLRAVY